MLRFSGVSFNAGGTFKLCFCDFTHRNACQNVTDFTIEVGTVHVSGVGCLLSQPRFQRVACETQFYGGLRCYRGPAPRLTAPRVPTTFTEFGIGAAVDAELEASSVGSWCLYGPEEITQNDPRCQLVAGFQGTR